MQAIILAAGMGKRLGDLTRNNTKCMVKVNDVPLIDRALTQLSRLDLSRVILVIGYEGEKLRAHVGESYKGLKITYIENPVYAIDVLVEVQNVAAVGIYEFGKHGKDARLVGAVHQQHGIVMWIFVHRFGFIYFSDAKIVQAERTGKKTAC